MSNLKVERELERKLKVLEVEEERRLKALTVKQHKIEQETLKLRVHTRSRPRHGENRLKRDRALASLPCSPISRRNNWRCSTSTESSGSSQEEYSSFPTPQPTTSHAHPNYSYYRHRKGCAQFTEWTKY